MCRAEKLEHERLSPRTAKSLIEVEQKGIRGESSVAATDWTALNANLRNLDLAEE